MVNPLPAKLIYLNFHPLDAVSFCRDQQPQVVNNYSYLFNLRPSIQTNKQILSLCLNKHFIPNNSDLFG